MEHYSFYVWKISLAALETAWGIAAILVFGLAVYCLLKSRRRFATVLSVIAIGSFITGFYSAEYDIPENFEQQRQIINQSDWESCGYGTAKPTQRGRGMSNPCGYGCFRGATVRKTLTMGEFPPWPRFQREVECWRRTGPWDTKTEPRKNSPRPSIELESE